MQNAYFQIPELRGFERFCRAGRSRRCRASCRASAVSDPAAHHMASCKATDGVYRVECRPPARSCASSSTWRISATRHIAHFYCAGRARFRRAAPTRRRRAQYPGRRRQSRPAVGTQVIRLAPSPADPGHDRRQGHAPGWRDPGWHVQADHRRGARRDRDRWPRRWSSSRSFSLKLFDEVVLQNQGYVSLILSEAYTIKTHYMGLVDRDGRVNFYDGEVRVIGAGRAATRAVRSRRVSGLHR